MLWGAWGRAAEVASRIVANTFEREQVRWQYVVGCFVAGGLMIAGAYWSEDHWSWQGVTPSVLVNLGTAFALAGLLFVLERRFVTVVRQASTEAAAQAADSVADRLEARTEALETRLADLDEQTARRVQAHREAQDRTISALEVVSFDTVTEVLATAAGLRALLGDRAEVQASNDRDGLWLKFSWGCNWVSTDFAGDPIFDDPKLMVEVLDDQTPLEVEWRPDDAAPDVAQRLVRELQSAGLWMGETMLNWQLALQNLQRTVDVAIRSRRKDPGAWHLADQLDRLVGDDWAITKAGIERLGHGVVLEPSDFLVSSPAGPGSQASAEVTDLTSLAPADTDPDLWSYLIREGKRRFPGITNFYGISSSQFEPDWVAKTDQPD